MIPFFVFFFVQACAEGGNSCDERVRITERFAKHEATEESILYVLHHLEQHRLLSRSSVAETFDMRFDAIGLSTDFVRCRQVGTLGHEACFKARGGGRSLQTRPADAAS